MAEDLYLTREEGEDIIYESMPHIGVKYSRGWFITSQLPVKISKNIRDMRMRFKSLDLKKIKYTNVHYKSSLSDSLPNSLDEFKKYKEYLNENYILKSLYKKVSDADRVIINGEGNIVNHIGTISNPYRIGARFLIFTAFICKDLNIPFSLVNCTIDPANELIDEVLAYILSSAHHVSVREPISYEYSKDKLNLNNVIESADSSVGYDFIDHKKRIKNNKPFLILGDSSGLRGDAEEIYKHMDYLIKHFKSQGYHIKLLDCSTPYSHVLGKLALKYNCSWLSDHYLNFRTLQEEFYGAKCIISGRWHPSILASNIGVRTITYGSDSCKTLGFAKKMNTEHISGGLEGLYKNIDLIEQNILSSSRKEIMQRNLEWSSLRFNNVLRPA